MSGLSNMHMLKMKTVILCLIISGALRAQNNLYFPPTDSDEWERVTPEELDWCTDAIDALYTMLEEEESKAFLVLKDGKIVLEKYYDAFTSNSQWPWFSAGKSLTAFLTGLAQEQGLLDIDDTSQLYLGEGWSTLSTEQEQAIKIKHHLSMTTGLDYNVSDPFCTEPACLQYLNPPGTHWYYHNAPYSIIRDILESATGQNLNVYTIQNMHNNIGMDGIWVPTGYNNFYFSSARSMARFGLLMLNNGDWNGTTIMHDKDYLNDMIHPSQDLNPSYGYLWWLNGQDNIKIPGSDIVFPGSFDPNAPEDMYCAAGANGQLLYVIPSENMIIVRMGNSSDDGLVAISLTQKISQYMSEVLCETSSITEHSDLESVNVFPNPTRSVLYLDYDPTMISNAKFEILNQTGRILNNGILNGSRQIDLSIPSGFYYLRIFNDTGRSTYRKIVKQ